MHSNSYERGQESRDIFLSENFERRNTEFKRKVH